MTQQEKDEQYMRRALDDVCECDMIYMLRGWERSRGARVERALAEYLDKVVAYEEERNDP